MVTEALNRRVVRVPDVVGRGLVKAQILLEDAGLKKIVVLYRESYEDRDTVLEQKPARGQMVYEGTEVTIWIARRGLLENLPAIYRRSDAVGRNLVRDVCFVFEHMFDSVEMNMIDGWRFYDPHVSPTGFLDWLAGWTAFTLDLDWPETQRRALVKRAVDLYRIRGTKRGLSLFLKLFTGHEPEIAREHVAVQRVPARGRGCRRGRAGRDRLGDPAAGRSRTLLRRQHADPVRRGDAGDGDPDPPDHPARKTGAHPLLLEVRGRGGRGRIARVLRDRPAVRHRDRRRSRRVYGRRVIHG